MNEVNFLGEDLNLVNEFNLLEDKKSVSWSDEKYSHVRKTIKEHYLKEQDYTCFFCRQRMVVNSNRSWDAEHIISKSTHPSFMFEPKNLCITCPDCNNEKRDGQVLDRESRVKFPMVSSAYKIVHPHFDSYDEHLDVIVVGKLYRIKTPKGRYTYRIYGLDRFMMDAGFSKEEHGSDKVQKLMQSALTDSKNYQFYEEKVLEELLLKHSKKIGSETTLDAIKKLRQ
ncbi:HNH endonuclease [Vibrio cholerae]|nr:hypothetical protein [Vibrio cholerae]EJL6422788.1 hypothetical protein [Vibrio cholerae]HEJ2461003.1 hypothetical protein [Vibrio cholerae]